jgi:hypothetical protein
LLPANASVPYDEARQSKLLTLRLALHRREFITLLIDSKLQTLICSLAAKADGRLGQDGGEFGTSQNRSA